jgi:hypothetical protein
VEDVSGAESSVSYSLLWLPSEFDQGTSLVTVAEKKAVSLSSDIEDMAWPLSKLEFFNSIIIGPGLLS